MQASNEDEAIQSWNEFAAKMDLVSGENYSNIKFETKKIEHVVMAESRY